jgi:hypothetical protein
MNDIIAYVQSCGCKGSAESNLRRASLLVAVSCAGKDFGRKFSESLIIFGYLSEVVSLEDF